MRYLESNTQCSCVQWFAYSYPKLRPLLFAVPNGGYRNPIEANRLIKEGVTAGVADVLLLYPSSGYNGLCIEFKTAKGRQAIAQKQWQKAVESVGYKYIICHTLEEFINLIKSYITQ